MNELKNFKKEFEKMYDAMGIKDVTLDICGQTFKGKAAEKISEEHELDEKGNVIKSYRLINNQIYVTDYEYRDDGKISKKITYLSSDKMLSKRGMESVEQNYIYDSKGRLIKVKLNDYTEKEYIYPTEDEDFIHGMIIKSFDDNIFTIEKYDRENRILEIIVKNTDSDSEYDSLEIYEYSEDSYTKRKITEHEILVQTFRNDGTVVSEELRNKPDDNVETVVLSRNSIINENGVIVGYEETKNGEILSRIEFNIDDKGRILDYSNSEFNFNFSYHDNYTSSMITRKDDGSVCSIDNYNEDGSIIESCKNITNDKYMYSYHSNENDVLLAYNEVESSITFGFDHDGLKVFVSTNGIMSVEYKTEKRIVKKEYFVALMSDFTSLYTFLRKKYDLISPFKIGKSYFTGGEIIKRDNTLGGMINGSYNKEKEGETE